MENQTYVTEFHLVPFSTKSSLIVFVFFLLYISGVLINIFIITVIYIDDQLHTPMYLFLCNLATVDICYTTTTVPNLLFILLSGDNTVSFIQCFTQMFFYDLAAFTEDLTIFAMAYDRYVAICHPLHYHRILSMKKCILFAITNWIIGCINSILFIVPVSYMTFCHSGDVHQFFCDTKALFNMSCAGSEYYDIVIYMEVLLFGFMPFVVNLASYVKIVRVILLIKSIEGRHKAFSTCSSHLTVVIIYYIIGFSVYMMPPSGYSNILQPILTVLYAVITPMINPLIYSLRNKDVKRSLLRLLRVKQSIIQ